MIAIVSSVPRERSALALLCETRGWPAHEADSVRQFVRRVRELRPRVVITRQKLVDGFSDDVMAGLAGAGLQTITRSIVLVPAGAASAVEARLVALGADCVLRDPVRMDVLLEYVAKFLAAPARSPGSARGRRQVLRFAGGLLFPAERVLQHGTHRVTLAPREVQLARLLAENQRGVLSYDALYNEILERPFRGDTSNMRVLLGKLAGSARKVGLELRRWIEVLPKGGYRYARGAGAPRPPRPAG